MRFRLSVCILGSFHGQWHHRRSLDLTQGNGLAASEMWEAGKVVRALRPERVAKSKG
jgi:hypothetical protein